jgi:hypothetical protein
MWRLSPSQWLVPREWRRRRRGSMALEAAKQELHEREAMASSISTLRTVRLARLVSHPTAGSWLAGAGVSLVRSTTWGGGRVCRALGSRRLSAVNAPTLGMPRGVRTRVEQTKAKRMMAGANRLGACLCCRLADWPHPYTCHRTRQAHTRCRIAAGSRPAFAVERGTRTPRVRFGPTLTSPAKSIGRPTFWGYVRRL